MYLHVGQDTVLRQRDILGVFDLDSASISKGTREYLARAQKEGRVVNVGEELPKSFIVCAGPDGRHTVYISQISSTTLLRRAERFDRGELSL